MSVAGAGASVNVDVLVPQPPPPEKSESKSVAPGFGYIWVAGHWDFVEGIYVWKAGRWLQGKPGYEYVRARCDYDGAQKSWVFRRSHWKRRQSPSLAAPSPAPTAPAAPSVPSTIDGGAAPQG